MELSFDTTHTDARFLVETCNDLLTGAWTPADIVLATQSVHGTTQRLRAAVSLEPDLSKFLRTGVGIDE